MVIFSCIINIVNGKPGCVTGLPHRRREFAYTEECTYPWPARQRQRSKPQHGLPSICTVTPSDAGRVAGT
jgi:hypothetical protein